MSSTYRTTGAILAACCLLIGPAAGAALADTPPALSDDAGGSALFSGTDPITPGDSRSACIAVSATGAQSGDAIAFAATDVTGDLAPFLTLRAEIGSGGRHGDCSGFTGTVFYDGSLTDLAATTGDGAPTGWRPAAAPARTFRITVSVASSSQALGLTSSASFSWRLVRLIDPGPTPAPTPAPSTSRPDPDPEPTPVPGTTIEPSPVPTADTTPAAVSTPASSPPGPSTSTGAVPGSPGPRRPVATLDIPATGERPARAHHGATWTQLRTQLLKALEGVIKEPGLTLGPLGVALLFLLTQHLIDMRDPKLAAASRTTRETMLLFPTDYVASLDITETG